MKVQRLSHTSFDAVLNCFLKAFENYYVKMPTDKEYYRERWKAAKVDFNLSYGMFDEGKLIGFLIHAVDKRNGVLTAFNTGTGVLPAYRGKRVVRSIYDFALKDLYENGVNKVKLEVITANEIAIRSYKGIGFEIGKRFKCFKGELEDRMIAPIELKAIDSNEISWDDLPNQHVYSWDNQKESLLNGIYSYFQVLNHNKVESFFIIQPENGYVAQFDILNTQNSSASWQRLFMGIKKVSSTIKINNVDEKCKEKNKQVLAIGLENHVDQYEMELVIKNI